MSRILIALALCAACSTKVGTEGEPVTDPVPAGEVEAPEAVAAAPAVPLSADMTSSHRAFALDAHRALATDGDNVVSSPVSIELALGMLSAGAAGETSSALAKLLRVPEDGSHHAINRGIMEAWTSSGQGYELAVANRIFAACLLYTSPSPRD